jgi:hypothetical protein
MNDGTDGSGDVNRAFMTYSTDAPLSGNCNIDVDKCDNNQLEWFILVDQCCWFPNDLYESNVVAESEKTKEWAGFEEYVKTLSPMMSGRQRSSCVLRSEMGCLCFQWVARHIGWSCTHI